MLPELQIDHISYLGIIVVLILTGCGLPIPEEVPIIAAGIASSVGSLNPWWAFLACLVGALLGDSVLYAIGYHFGHSLIIRHPRFAHLLHAEHEARIEEMIRRHGLKVFFGARFMVGIRAGLPDSRHLADVVPPLRADRCFLRSLRGGVILRPELRLW